MAIRNIHTYGDPCLREKAQAVGEVAPETLALAADMLETMYAAKGIGLAAPQVGAGVRVFVLDVDWVEHEGGPEKHQPNPRVFIDPEITWESAEDIRMSEGCLSLPGIEGDVFRPQEVKVAYTDRKGARRERKLAGLEARCVQHEIDHLNGVLFVDRMPFVRRQMLAGKLSTLKKRQKTIEDESAA
jgi:peptide deformylase